MASSNETSDAEDEKSISIFDFLAKTGFGGGAGLDAGDGLAGLINTLGNETWTFCGALGWITPQAFLAVTEFFALFFDRLSSSNDIETILSREKLAITYGTNFYFFKTVYKPIFYTSKQ